MEANSDLATDAGTMSLRQAISNLTNVEKELLRNWLKSYESVLSFPSNHSPAAAFLLWWQKDMLYGSAYQRRMVALLLSTITQEPVEVRSLHTTYEAYPQKGSTTGVALRVVQSPLAGGK